MSPIDTQEFQLPPFINRPYRNALGSFPTGVTVVTALSSKEEKLGITVNSFSSVSLDPALVLWSIDCKASCFSDFVEAQYFAVHILDENQRALSNRFASSDHDKFAGLPCTRGDANVPLLPDYSACFQCQVEHRYAGGDHVIIVGRVNAFLDRNRAPLVYYRGDYAQL